MAAGISVVVPALDEERLVAAAVASVREDADEVLVVDGGSRDRTRERAAAAGARVVASPPGRGRQLDAGARQARGEWLVFLHADTRLDAGWAAALAALGPEVVGGAFRFALDSARLRYRVVEAGVRLRCRFLKLALGDQAIFARRAAWAAVGGFGGDALMEDVAFVRRLARCGPLAFPAVRARTSPRRWERRGLLRTTALNWTLLALHAAGVPADRLARLYGRPVREGVAARDSLGS